MMVSLNLNVKESAYDKIIYFLTHLKDDVVILNKPEKQNITNHKNSLEIEEFRALSKQISHVDRSIDILSLEREINRDIF